MASSWPGSQSIKIRGLASVVTRRTVMGQDASMGRVVVVGSLNIDRPWRVARHPGVGETVAGEQRALLPGGKGLNQAVAAARLGAQVALVGCVGADDHGAWLADVAALDGIDTAMISVATDVTTGTALIVVDADGRNTVTVDAGANACLEVGPLGLGPGDVVVAQLEIPADAVAEAFAQARRAGALAVLNPSPLGAGPSLVDLADVLVVNEHEAAALVGVAVEVVTADPLAVARSLATREQTVVVTLGASGVAAVSRSGEHQLAGRSVPVLDTTGAGDCFLGVLAAGLASACELGEALDRANRAAAIAVTREGTVPAMPFAHDLG